MLGFPPSLGLFPQQKEGSVGFTKTVTPVLQGQMLQLKPRSMGERDPDLRTFQSTGWLGQQLPLEASWQRYIMIDHQSTAEGRLPRRHFFGTGPRATYAGVHRAGVLSGGGGWVFESSEVL